jgi:hypothetical protein
MLQAWEMAWDGHALRSHPGRFWDSNTFWPLRDTLAFSDALVGYTPAGFVGSGRRDALFRYGVMLIFSCALAAFGAYALARVLGASKLGGAAAGAAFGFSPWRIAQMGHLNVLASGGIPLSLALLVYGYRRSSRRAVIAGWLVAAWQVTLGFALGFPFLYLLLFLACWVLVQVLRRRAWPSRGVLWATAAGVVILIVTAALLARPYLRVLDEFPEARRSLDDVVRFSPSFAGLAAAPRHDLVWGALTSHPRSLLNWPEEQTIFPGLLVLLLAGYCLLRGRDALPRRVAVGLGIGACVTAVLALGLGPGRLMPYRLLYEFAPGWQGIRAPDRIFTLTSLGLALLAAGGLTAFQAVSASRRRQALSAVAVAVVLAEGIGSPPLLTPPSPPKVQLEAPVFFLPSHDVVDSLYMLWSTDGFPEIVNGASGFRPRYIDAVRSASLRFPGPHSVELFRRLGVRTIVVDRRLTGQTGWRVLPGRSVAGLPLNRESIGPWIVYRLPPYKG